MYYRDGGMGRLGGERGRGKGGKGEEWLEGGGVVIVSCLFITSFFFNHSTVCSIKVKPIER